MSQGTAKLWRAREVIASVVVLGWALFHVWEQFAAFGGRPRFMERMMATSHGSAALFVEVLFGVGPIVLWLGLEARLVFGGREPEALRECMAEDPDLARRVGSIVRVGSWLFLFFLVVHVGWLWLPKLTEGAEPLRTWMRLREELGTWPMAVVHALGLTGFVLHGAAAPIRVATVFGGLPSPQARRAARWSGLIVVLGVALLLAQLIGWHAAGTGTVWSM